MSNQSTCGCSNVSKSNSDGKLCEPAVESWWFMSDFSIEELFILRSSFEAVRHRLENVAVMAFMSLFDHRPDAFSIFVGKKVLPSSRHDVAYSWETKQHGLRVLNIVEKCVNRIDKWDLVQEIVTALALRHLKYGAKPVHVLALFGCLRQALLQEMENTSRHSSMSDINSTVKRPSPESPYSSQFRLSVSAINGAWNKFFRTLGLALVAEMLSLQEEVPQPTPAAPQNNEKKEFPKSPSKARMSEGSKLIKAVTAKLSIGSDK